MAVMVFIDLGAYHVAGESALQNGGADNHVFRGGVDMMRRILGVAGRISIIAVNGPALFLIGMSGCASEPPKPAVAVTPDQVRGHADKTFEKLKQEEQGRPADSAMPR